VTQAALVRAVAERNELRKKVAEAFTLQEDGGISGAAVFSLLADAAEGDLPSVKKKIDTLMAAARPKTIRTDEARIVVSANVLDRPDLVEMIEGAGARVVALDSCTGVRHWEGPVAEGTSDPVRAIAERYLTRPPCSRMEGIGRRIDWLVDLATRTRADGVILSTVKYCDLWLYDRPQVAEALEKAGIRVLSVENDYEWSGAGQTKTRIEAFVETLRHGGAQCSN